MREKIRRWLGITTLQEEFNRLTEQCKELSDAADTLPAPEKQIKRGNNRPRSMNFRPMRRTIAELELKTDPAYQKHLEQVRIQQELKAK